MPAGRSAGPATAGSTASSTRTRWASTASISKAKRYKPNSPIGAKDIQAFFGAFNMAKAAKGVFITTSSFTKAAQETAEKLGSRIVLIDGGRLAQLMIRFDVGVRIEQTFNIKKIDEDLFLDA